MNTTIVDESTKLDCTFDNFLACNYKLLSSFGGSWSWTSWSQLVPDPKDNRRETILLLLLLSILNHFRKLNSMMK